MGGEEGGERSPIAVVLKGFEVLVRSKHGCKGKGGGKEGEKEGEKGVKWKCISSLCGGEGDGKGEQKIVEVEKVVGVVCFQAPPHHHDVKKVYLDIPAINVCK